MVRKRKKPSSSNTVLVPLGLLVVGCCLVPRAALYGLTIALAATGFRVAFRWYRAYRRRKRVLESGIREIDVMQGVEFERYLYALFETAGFKVDTTPGSGDFGADLVLRKDGRTTVVQAKRYHRTVGIDAVQAAHASATYYRANESWVVTNQDFSPAARELATKSGVRLIDRDELISMITRLRRNTARCSVRHQHAP